MLTFHIGRWHNTYRSRAPLPGGRTAEWDAGLAMLDGERLAAGVGGEDEWVLVRKVAVQTRLDVDNGSGGGSAQAGRAWEQALAGSLRAALAEGGDNVVRYRDRRDAVADMVYRAAVGDVGRAWAWRRMGLAPGEARSLAALRERAWQALVSEREGIWPLLVRLLHAEGSCGALTALVRTLPAERWHDVLAHAPQTHPYTAGAAGLPDSVPHAAGADVGASGADPGATVAFDTPGAAALLAWVHAQPVLARRHGEMVAILLAALCRPSAWTVPAPAAVLACAWHKLASVLPEAGTARRRWPARAGMARHESDSARIADRPAASESRPADLERQLGANDAEGDEGDEIAAPELPDSAGWRVTSWAGLPFLLQLVPASGVLSHPQVADAVPVFLWRLALALGVPGGDAAVAAFCGGWLPAPAERDAPAALWTETDALAARTADAWERWLAPRAADLPAPRLVAICRRPGRIRFEPGWLEVHLPLDAADARLRRLALDIDPGWLPWLGCVLRIRYA